MYRPSNCFGIMHDLPRSRWVRQLGQRIAYLWWLKASGTMLFMVIFFWGYFAVLRHPLGEPTQMPLTALDRAIPFTVSAYPAYVWLWVYASLAPAFLREFRFLWRYGVWVAAMCLICLVIFWIFPTVVPPSGIDWSQYPQMSLIKRVDQSGNACPSLHVAAAIFSALWMHRVYRNIAAPGWLRLLNGLQCAAIVWSTVAIRQHVALDVLAGIAVGAGFGLIAIRQVSGGHPGHL